ncbi:MAG: RsmD family RNA methyltransferase [Thiohalomonas sp.]|nr:RsmD family RNA methyltransferase [Thiohalomonas sp.]
MNRARVQHYAKDKRVLDLFSYVGACWLETPTAGASEVFCVDASEQALEYLDSSAEMNNFKNITSIRVMSLMCSSIYSMKKKNLIS